MIYPIPEYLHDSHDGDEWAIAAILGGRVVALRYISDIAPEIELDETAIRKWLDSQPIDMRELQALGDVHAGTINSDGLNARWKVANTELST
jgi:hypothetical protein